MASSLFQNQQNQKNNLISQLNQFQKMVGSKDPKQMVQDLIQSGKMSQQQFERLGQQATSFMAGFRK